VIRKRKPTDDDITPEVDALLNQAMGMILKGCRSWVYTLPDGSEVEELTAVQAAQIQQAYGGNVRYTGGEDE
jgi:hypothetical protein